MLNIKKTAVVIGCAVCILFASCLKSGLPDYPKNQLNYINKVYFEYRWEDSTNMYNGSPVVAYERLNVTQTIDSAHSTITLQVSVPPASGSFNAYQRSLVSPDHLWCSLDVSPAATVAPVGSAPKLGFAGDFTQPAQYSVSANPGDARIWTLTIASFTK
jgi:hypothetical protein